MTTHIMLDLETWGKRPGCDIRSIGAVVFDPIAGTVGSPELISGVPEKFKGIDHLKFYVATENPVIGNKENGWVETLGFTPNPIDPRYDPSAEIYRKYPLARDPETGDWWNKQSPEAQAAFANPVDLWQACSLFTSWVINMYPTAPEEPSPDFLFWSNGPHFDASILDAVFHAVGLPVPWHYRAPRDFRTITDAAGMTRDEFSNYGDAHNALHDAIAQAMTVCEAYKRLGLQRS